jgi:hypothetical protein
MSIKIYKTTVVGRKMNKLSNNITLTTCFISSFSVMGRLGRDRMVVGFTTT